MRDPPLGEFPILPRICAKLNVDYSMQQRGLKLSNTLSGFKAFSSTSRCEHAIHQIFILGVTLLGLLD